MNKHCKNKNSITWVTGFKKLDRDLKTQINKKIGRMIQVVDEEILGKPKRMNKN